MNRFGFCKQEGPVFRIRDLNSPWRSVLHLGQRQMVGKSYQWEDDPETSTFSFLEKGRVRLLNLSETGKERIVLYIEPGCLFREIVLLHVSPSHPASLVALEPCEVYNFPRTLLDDAEFVRRHPALMSNLVHSLGAKAGAFYSQITESVELDPQTQVCRYLHRLADERPDPRGQPRRVAVRAGPCARLASEHGMPHYPDPARSGRSGALYPVFP